MKVDKVFCAIPEYRAWSTDYDVFVPETGSLELKQLKAARRFLIDINGWHLTHPEDGLFFEDGGTTGLNTTYATSDIARCFIEEKHFASFDWMLWWANDQTLHPSDVRLLIDCARRFEIPVIGGIVTTRKKPPLILAGTFDPEHPAEVRFFRRGIEIIDTDVSNKRTKKVEVFGGGGLIHRSVLEKFKPELNDGLAYFCYDKQTPSYDWRFFQRLKEKGIGAALQCGVIIHHWGLDEAGEEHGYNYFESPVFNVKDPKRFDNPEEWPETLKPEESAVV